MEEMKELKPLEQYSAPVCRCESTGTITNALGQTLEIKVRGKDPGLVEEYMKTVRLTFVALSEEDNAQVWEEPTEEPTTQQSDRWQAFIDDELKGLKILPELELEIELDVTDTNGLELPYDLNVDIDPNIASGETHKYKTKKPCSKEKVTMKATVNGVIGVLSGPGDSTNGQADRLQETPYTDTAKMTVEAAAGSDFTFTVNGIRANNTYSQSASMKLVRQ
jgi:hypothetical protein